MPNQHLLVINVGSSSLKFALFLISDLSPVLRGVIHHYENKLRLQLKNNSLQISEPEALSEKFTIEMGMSWLLAWLERHHLQFAAVGHRVVHGGEDYSNAIVIDHHHIAKLRLLTRLAPLHQPFNLAAIEIMQKKFPNCLQVACFDTAFHHSISAVASTYALPKYLREQGLRRYGFHGLAYEFVTDYVQEHFPDIAQGKLLAAHLGSGCSACAIENGKSLDSTMGFTAVEGLPMATRCGAVDPGLIYFLFDQMGLDAEKIQHILYKESGLLGLSDYSADMRELLLEDSEATRFAVDYFVYQTTKHLGALYAVLGGIDALIFSGGIGENSATIRQRIATRFLPITNRPEVPIIIVPMDEELVIAKNVKQIAYASII